MSILQYSQRKFILLAIPNILSNFSSPLASLIDIAFLGHLPSILPLAGVALGTMIFDYVYWSFGFLRMGTTGVTAIAFGRRDGNELAAILYRTILIALVSGSVLVLLSQPINWLAFALLQSEAAVEAQAMQYFFARIWGAPFALAGFAILGWLLGQQRPRLVMAYAFILHGLNVFFDWYFIYRLNWGAAGAGYATMVAECIACLAGLVFVWMVNRGVPDFHSALVCDWPKMKNLLKLNIDILIRTFCLISAFSLFTAFSANFGPVILAANTILIRLLNSAAYFLDGFAFALESIAGEAYGAGNHPVLRKSFRHATLYSFGTALIICAVYFFFPLTVLGVLTDHQAVIDQCMQTMGFMILILCFSNFAYVLDGLFIGLARGPILRNASVITTVFGFLPLALFAVYSESPQFLWWAMFLFTLFRLVTLGVPAWRLLRKHEIQDGRKQAGADKNGLK